MRNLREELDAPSADSVERWDPIPGDSIVGAVVGFENRNRKYGPCRVVIVQDENDGTHRAVWLQHKILRELFDAEGPRRGDRLGIKRLADGKGKNGPFARYHLVIERAPGDNGTSPNDPPDRVLDADGRDIPF